MRAMHLQVFHILLYVVNDVMLLKYIMPFQRKMGLVWFLQRFIYMIVYVVDIIVSTSFLPFTILIMP